MSTTTMFYVGIDVSKDKSDICIKDENGNDLVQRFKITNSRADLGRLYETIERTGRGRPARRARPPERPRGGRQHHRRGRRPRLGPGAGPPTPVPLPGGAGPDPGLPEGGPR